MTNLEKYLGIVLNIQNVVDPLTIDYLEKEALKVATLARFNIEEFFVYVHTITIEPTRKKDYFGIDFSISERAKELEVIFKVNKKQTYGDKIKFYNALITSNCEPGVKEYLQENSLKRTYTGEIIENHGTFTTCLITYVSKKLHRDDHRKIKLIAQAYPTKMFKRLLKKDLDYHTTEKDLKLDQEVQLLLFSLTDDQIKKTKGYIKSMVDDNKLCLVEGEKTGINNIEITGSNVSFQVGDKNRQNNKYNNNENINQTIENLAKIIPNLGLDKWDEHDCIEETERLKNLCQEKEIDENVIFRIEKRIGLIKSILSKSKEVYEICAPYLHKITNYFGADLTI